MTHKDILPSEQKVKKVIPGMITLPAPDKSEIYGLNKLLKDEVYSLLDPLAKLIRKDKVTLSPLSSKSTKPLYNAMIDDSSMRALLKGELITIYSSFASDLNNIFAVAATAKKFEEFWKTMLLSYEMSVADVTAILGREIQAKHYYGWDSNFMPEVLFFPLEVSYEAPNFYYYDSFKRKERLIYQLPAKYRQRFTDYFFGPDAAKPHCYKTLPEDKDFRIENFEPQIATDLVTLAGLALNGSMLSANGSITANVVKRIKKQSRIKEFPPILDAYPLDRIELLSLAYFYELRKESISTRDIPVKRFVRYAVERFPEQLSGTQFNSFLPAYQGFTKLWADRSYAKEIALCVKQLLQPAKEEWLDMDNFHLRLLNCNEFEENSIFKLFKYSDREKSNLRRRIEKDFDSIGENVIKPIDWFGEIGYKFALNWIRFLCAIGVVEIAMDNEVKVTENDPLGGMRFVRLTPLGRYAFGIDNDYTPTVAEEFGGIEYDALNGIITVANADSPYVMFLSTVAKQISPTRFKISLESLMKGCRKKSELESRILSLKSVINVDKEPTLLKLTKEALSRTECAEKVGGYSLLKLKSNQTGLLDLITKHKELRTMTLLTASRSMVLVKTDDLEKFYNICAANGYLME